MFIGISCVSAQITKQTTSTTGKYPDVIIKDSGIQQAKFRLIYNTEHCGGVVRCASLIRVDLANSRANILEGLKFMDEKQGSETSITSYKIMVGKLGGMTEYTSAKTYSGSFYIYIEGTKENDEIIDWIPTFYGQEISEWAVWGIGLNRNLIAYWKFDETSGNKAVESVSSKWNITTYNTPAWVAGKIGNALEFKATSSQFAKNGSTLDWTMTNTNFTMNFWLNYSGTGSNPFMVKSSAICGVELDTAPPDYVLYVGNCVGGYYPTISTPYTEDSYDMLTILSNTSGTHLFKNGVLVGNTSNTPQMPTNALDIAISRDRVASSGYIDGEFDEFGVWNRTLTESEISDLYNSGAGISYTAISLDLSPADNSILLYTSPIEFRVNATSVSNLVNVSLYINGTFVENKTFTGSNNVTTFSKTLGIGNHSWYVHVCDELQCENSVPRFLNTTYFKINSFVYNTSTYETLTESFIVNVSYDSSLFNNLAVYLDYNKTATYLASQSGSGDTITFYKSISIPIISANNNRSFSWIFNLTNATGTETKTSETLQQYTQKGTTLSSGESCASGFLPAVNFTFKDEALLSYKQVNVSYYFTYGLSNSSIYTINSSQTSVSSFLLCINATQGYYNIGYGEVQYSATGYAPRRYYLFSNTRITNSTTNLTLYNLLDSDSTSFLLIAKTISLISYKNYYVGLLRWYPATADYKVVEMGKTDDKGETILHVKVEDVDYRLALYAQDGTLVELLQPIRMICQAVPCTYSIFVDPNPLDLTAYTNIQSSLTYDKTLKKFTFIWNDPSQAEQTMNLSVWKQTGTTEIIVCSSTASGYTGILSCDVSSSTGLLKAEVVRTASPNVIFAQLYAEIRSTIISAGGGTLGLFIGAILLIFFALIGVISPVLVVILGIISLIPLFLIGSIQWALFTAIAVIGGVILHFLNRNTNK